MLKIASESTAELFLEVVSSKPDIITAKRNLGKIHPGGTEEIEVKATAKAFSTPHKR